VQSLLGDLEGADPSAPSTQATLESLTAFLSAMMGAMGAASQVAYCLRYPSDASMPKALAGKRHSEGDQKMLQAMHDTIVKLGADCTPVERKAERTHQVRADGGRWVVYGQDGVSRLATHATKEEAEAQATAIEMALQRFHNGGAAAASHGHCACGGGGK
jgi:hypothetical protein